MAQTDLHKYTVQEKLNKMDIDLIQVEIDDATTGSIGVDDLLADTRAIPNAVANNGDCAILQSMSVVCKTDTNTDPVKVVFTSNDTAFASIGDTHAKDILGFLTINKNQTVPASAASSFGSLDNIGLVLKAKADERSVYFYVLSGGTTTYSDDDLIFNFGIMKD